MRLIYVTDAARARWLKNNIKVVSEIFYKATRHLTNRNLPPVAGTKKKFLLYHINAWLLT
jgi:hypothetical protein